MQWYLAVLKNYVGFSGRARRKEFWMFTLFSVIISIVLAIIDHLIGTASPIKTSTPHGVSYNFTGGLISGLYGLAVLLPTLAVQVRRLHDINCRGWWIFIVLIPIIGVIILLVFNATDGDRGPNRFGPDPKSVDGGFEGPPPAMQMP